MDDVGAGWTGLNSSVLAAAGVGKVAQPSSMTARRMPTSKVALGKFGHFQGRWLVLW